MVLSSIIDMNVGTMKCTPKYFFIISKSILAPFVVAFLTFVGNAYAGLSTQADATIVDSNAGLAWMPEGNTPAVNTCAGSKKTWAEAFEYVVCLNSTNYLGHSDWRLPTVEEISTLGTAFTEGQLSIAAKLNANGFSSMHNAYYWTSSSGSDPTAVATDMLWNGQAHPMNKASRNYVLAVRTAGN